MSQSPQPEPRHCLCGCGAEIARFFAQGHDARFATQLADGIVAGKLTDQQRTLLNLPGNWAVRKDFKHRSAAVSRAVAKLDPRLVKTAAKVQEWALAKQGDSK